MNYEFTPASCFLNAKYYQLSITMRTKKGVYKDIFTMTKEKWNEYDRYVLVESFCNSQNPLERCGYL
jgi:hypothetical protein